MESEITRLLNSGKYSPVASFSLPRHSQTAFVHTPTDFSFSTSAFKNDEERITGWVKNKLQVYPFRSVQSMATFELKQICNILGIDTLQFLEKAEFIHAVNTRRGTDCSICKKEFYIDEKLCVTLCGHSFHETCLITWLNMNPKSLKCAFCNQNPFDMSRDATK